MLCLSLGVFVHHCLILGVSLYNDGGILSVYNNCMAGTACLNIWCYCFFNGEQGTVLILESGSRVRFYKTEVI